MRYTFNFFKLKLIKKMLKNDIIAELIDCNALLINILTIKPIKQWKNKVFYFVQYYNFVQKET